MKTMINQVTKCNKTKLEQVATSSQIITHKKNNNKEMVSNSVNTMDSALLS